MKKFWLGFAACYAMAGFVNANNVADIPATTKAGVVYSFFMWAPVAILPHDMALSLVPEWVFDFSGKEVV